MEIPRLFHPLLFSFFPTFYVYSQNIHVLIPTELLLPLLVISGGTVVGFFILGKILKRELQIDDGTILYDNNKLEKYFEENKGKLPVVSG